jgi:hypothetical protein
MDTWPGYLAWIFVNLFDHKGRGALIGYRCSIWVTLKESSSFDTIWIRPCSRVTAEGFGSRIVGRADALPRQNAVD